MSKHLKSEIKHLKTMLKSQQDYSRQGRKYLQKEIRLRGKNSEIAINKAETAMLERMESSNNKFGLLKEQATEFATKADLRSLNAKVELLQKMAYIGFGGLLVIEFIIKYLK